MSRSLIEQVWAECDDEDLLREPTDAELELIEQGEFLPGELEILDEIALSLHTNAIEEEAQRFYTFFEPDVA